MVLLLDGLSKSSTRSRSHGISLHRSVHTRCSAIERSFLLQAMPVSTTASRRSARERSGTLDFALGTIGHPCAVPFSEVFKARCKKTNSYVAMKLILMDQEKEGFPITALREIKILQELRHNNIVRLIEVCRSASMEKVLPKGSSLCFV